VPVNTLLLAPGVHYRLCLDLDGMVPKFGPGDSGLSVYASGVVAEGPLSVQPAPAQALRLHCAACSQAVSVHLGVAGCNESEKAAALLGGPSAIRTSPPAALAIITSPPPALALVVNAGALRVGMSYKLCVDLDGDGAQFVPGDAGPVYVSPVSQVMPAVVSVGKSLNLVLQCASCRTVTNVFLAASCESASAFPATSILEGNSHTCPKHLPECITYEYYKGAPRGGQLVGTERTPAAPLLPDVARTAQAAPTRQWRATIATEGLSEGVAYKVCLDLDGPQDAALPVGDTGFTVYVTPVQNVMTRVIHRAPYQRISLTCPKCVLGVATLRLARSCAAGISLRPAEATAVGVLDGDAPVQADTARRVDLDASQLLIGARYEICVDADGSGELPEGAVGEVIVTPVAVLTPAAVRQKPAQRLRMCCEGCSGATQARVALSCTDAAVARAGSAGAVVFLAAISRAAAPPAAEYRWNRIGGTSTGGACSGSTGREMWYELTFDASTFTLGGEYALCLDVDGATGGLDFVDTGGRVYITAVYELAIASVAPRPHQILRVKCEGAKCNGGAAALLAATCDTADVTGVTRANPPHHSNAMPLGFGSGSRQWFWDWDNFTATSWGSSYLPASGGPWFDASVDASGLTIGVSYRLCVDLDGPGMLALGDTGLEVFVSPFACGGSGTVTTSHAQPIELACNALSPEHCSAAVGYLGTACDGAGASPAGLRAPQLSTRNTAMAPVTAAISAAAQKAVNPQATPAWRMLVDASGLEPGLSYRVCLDVDGPGPADFADSGCRAYVAGVLAVEPETVEADRPQQFTLHCAHGLGCRVGTRVALCNADMVGTGGDAFRRTPVALLQRTDVAWQVTLSLAGLEVGNHYQVCVDLHGVARDPAWVATGHRIFLTGGITASPASLRRASGERLSITCQRGCSTATQVFIASTCQGRFAAVAAAAYESEMPLSRKWTAEQVETTRLAPLVKTTGSALAKDSGVAVGAWTVTLDLQMLRAGLPARLCIDYGGGIASGRPNVGDSGIAVYVAGITAASIMLRRSAQEALLLTCAQGCSVGVSEAFLAKACTPALPAAIAASKPGSAQEFNGGGGPSTAWTARGRLHGAAPTFEVMLDTRSLRLGQDYRVCADLDGPMGSLPLADTGLTVHVSAVALRAAAAGPGGGPRARAAEQHLAVKQAAAQTLLLACTEGCGVASRIFLASACSGGGGGSTDPYATFLVPDGFVAGGGSLGGFGASAWRATLDLSSLALGRYRLCADLDGLGQAYAPGDTGVEVEVTSTLT